MTRHELMRRVAAISPTDAFTNALAGDVLGLSEVEFRIVAGLYNSDDGRGYWGFSPGLESDTWVALLGAEEQGDLGELLLRGRLELNELRELIELDFINPGATMVFQWDETCDLADATIDFLDAPWLHESARILHRKAGRTRPSRSARRFQKLDADKP